MVEAIATPKEINDFRSAFLYAASVQKNQSAATTKRIAKAAAADPKKHKRLWKAMENICAHRYERQTGNKIKSFGDGQFLQWLVDNLPTILKLIMSILAMFGA